MRVVKNRANGDAERLFAPTALPASLADFLVRADFLAAAVRAERNAIPAHSFEVRNARFRRGEAAVNVDDAAHYAASKNSCIPVRPAPCSSQKSTHAC